MNFTEQIILSERRKEAEDELSRMQKRLESLRSMLNDRSDGNGRGGLIGRCAATCAWAAAFLLGIRFLRYRVYLPYVNYIVTATAIVSALIVLLLLISDILQLTHYSVILNHRSAIDRMRSNLDQYCSSSLSVNYQESMDKKAQGWAAPLPVTASLYTETDRIEREITGMESIRDGALQKLLTIVYYPLCIAWTILLSLFIGEYFYGIAYSIADVVDVSVSYDFIYNLRLVLIGLAAIGEIFMAKLVWGKTGCSVTNVTLFAILVGPLLTVGLALVCVLLTFLIYLVVVVVKAVIPIIAVIVGGWILISTWSGG